MIDLKVINSVLTQMEEERGIPKEKILEAIEMALASAYKKEYGKRGQDIRAKFDINSGKTEMFQVKLVVDESTVFTDEDEYEAYLDDRREHPENFVDEKARRKRPANFTTLNITLCSPTPNVSKKAWLSVMKWFSPSSRMATTDALPPRPPSRS
jgi:hypothetical protein